MKILVVISTHNKLGYLQFCLPTYQSLCGVESDISWLYIDDGSSDGTWEFLAGFTHGLSAHAAIRNLEPLGISANKNVGIDKAIREGFDRLVFLDDDLLLSPFWLRRMVSISTVYSDYLVSPMIFNDKTMLTNIEIKNIQFLKSVEDSM